MTRRCVMSKAEENNSSPPGKEGRDAHSADGVVTHPNPYHPGASRPPPWKGGEIGLSSFQGGAGRDCVADGVVQL
jgi:hypothetical protein